MLIVNILGGLGNQMFQYAFAIALQKQFPNDQVKIDIHSFKGYPLHNGFELSNIFDLKLPYASNKDLLTIGYPVFHYRIWQIMHHLLPNRNKIYKEKQSMVYDPQALIDFEAKYFDGYWQSAKYFENFRSDILSVFKFQEFEDENNKRISEDIKEKIYVSIHVRRGDYLKSKYFRGIGTIEYYKKAIDHIKSKVKIDGFLVFSNDHTWCKNNLDKFLDEYEIIHVDWNKGENSYRDIQLMSLCNHNIVANSSFSWWGAWLNQHSDKIIIAPSKWKNVD